jgi:mRNA-degrading endonuclease toxin of MazEF toxin-antitoxin module
VPIQLGDILWVRMVDPNGVNEKVRPAVVVTASNLIASGAPIVVAAITTTLPDPLTEDLVELPWHPRGTVKTGLRKRSAVACHWLFQIDPARVQKRSGHVPGDKLKEILQKIKDLETLSDQSE